MKLRIKSLIIGGTLIIVYLARVIYLNVMSEEYEVNVVTYEMGEIYEFDEFAYRIKSFSMYTNSELAQKFNLELGEVDRNEFYIVAEIETKYTGRNKKKCYISDFSFESGSWSNGVAFLTAQINEQSEFCPNETRILYAVSLVSEAHYGYKGWEKKARNRGYTLVRYEYPKVAVMKCY